MSTNISEKLDIIQTSLQNAKTSLENKGVVFSETDNIETWSAKIDELSIGDANTYVWEVENNATEGVISVDDVNGILDASLVIVKAADADGNSMCIPTIISKTDGVVSLLGSAIQNGFAVMHGWIINAIRDQEGSYVLNSQTMTIASTDDLDDKVDKIDGKGLSTNDFTDEWIDKINLIESSKIYIVDPEDSTEAALSGLKSALSEDKVIFINSVYGIIPAYIINGSPEGGDDQYVLGGMVFVDNNFIETRVTVNADTGSSTSSTYTLPSLLKDGDGSKFLSDDGTYREIEIDTTPMVSVSYTELKELRDNESLVPGMKYRIIDYVTSTAAENTQSAGHMFDIVVTALDESHLDEKASATHSVRDTAGYFSNADLGAWDIRYKLDPDPDTYEWTTANDTGVIYRMIDDKGNDCPYDFVNIMFKHGDRFYTTIHMDQDQYNIYTSSHNVLSPGCWNIILYVDFYCYNNRFGVDCKDIYLAGLSCTDNVFKAKCTNITQTEGRCDNNKIGSNCYNIVFNETCRGNILEYYCEGININGYGNKIGGSTRTVSITGNGNNVGVDNINTNITGSYNSVGGDASYININGDANKIGSKCVHIYLSYSTCNNNEICSECNRIKLVPTNGSTGVIQNVRMGSGVEGPDGSISLTFSVPTDANYEVKVAKNTSGEVKTYCEADLIA